MTSVAKQESEVRNDLGTRVINRGKAINSPLEENGNEKEKIPLHPLKRKSKGKRNKTGML